MKRSVKKHTARRFSLISLVLIVLLGTSAQSFSGQESTLKLKVVAEQANIRLEPDIASVIIRQVPQGTILESTGKEGEWHAVKLTSKEGAIVSGYVHESLVVMAEAFPQQKEKPRKIQEAPPDIEADKSQQTKTSL